MKTGKSSEEYIKCPECHGKGHIETINCKSGSASMCCASCFEKIECEECKGSGEVENENFEE